MALFLEIDRSKWKKPTYLGHYDEYAIHYEAIACRCKKCGCSFVFSAESQKFNFEIERKYPGWLPTLCPVCSERWDSLKKEVAKFDSLWKSDSTRLVSDKEFLSRWFECLKDAQDYQQKDYMPRMRMLVSTIGDG